MIKVAEDLLKLTEFYNAQPATYPTSYAIGLYSFHGLIKDREAHMYYLQNLNNFVGGKINFAFLGIPIKYSREIPENEVLVTFPNMRGSIKLILGELPDAS